MRAARLERLGGVGEHASSVLHTRSHVADSCVLEAQPGCVSLVCGAAERVGGAERVRACVSEGGYGTVTVQDTYEARDLLRAYCVKRSMVQQNSGNADFNRAARVSSQLSSHQDMQCLPECPNTRVLLSESSVCISGVRAMAGLCHPDRLHQRTDPTLAVAAGDLLSLVHWRPSRPSASDRTHLTGDHDVTSDRDSHLRVWCGLAILRILLSESESIYGGGGGGDDDSDHDDEPRRRRVSGKLGALFFLWACCKTSVQCCKSKYKSRFGPDPTAASSQKTGSSIAKRVHRHWHGPESRETSRVQGGT
eukprot:1408170-Rhodomonas_salina.1